MPVLYEENVLPDGFLREQGLQFDVVNQEQSVLVKEGAK